VVTGKYKNELANLDNNVLTYFEPLEKNIYEK